MRGSRLAINRAVTANLNAAIVLAREAERVVAMFVAKTFLATQQEKKEKRKRFCHARGFLSVGVYNPKI